MHALTFRNRRHTSRISLAALLMLIFIIFFSMNMYNNAGGIYSKELNLIAIFPKNNSTYFQFYTAAHEIGHYVYYNKLTAEDRAEYEQLFYSSDEYITDYSKTNAVENFVEEFAGITYTFVYEDFVSNSRKDFFRKNIHKMLDYNYE